MQGHLACALLTLSFGGGDATGPLRSIIPRWGTGAGGEQWRERAGLALLTAGKGQALEPV